MASLQETFGDAEWIVNNYSRLQELFPTQRTQVDLGFMTRMGFQFKLLGVDWRTNDQLAQAMLLCRHLRLYNQWRSNDTLWVARSEQQHPPTAFFNLSLQQQQVSRLLQAEPHAQAVALCDEVLAKFRRPQPN